ncbi:hypothetical protein M407DRAFT_221499 [Tulasnella calospora MUT 4182]|uniref:Pentacotripeptide-repeat region of PRORP domain-containing protein n=1 Tax=Tulasnella calospora MUT 4182 TaxID=1051891 RepID=A0A0C3QSM6_9AGAM|nr:hypothetical protein M407DRAFT_221499 [Tulasnella calospora MUT 4182]
MASCSRSSLLSATKFLYSPHNPLHSPRAGLRLRAATEAGPSYARNAATVARPNKAEAKGLKDRPTDGQTEKTANFKSSQRRYALVRRPDVTDGHARPSQRPYGVAIQVEKLLKAGQLDEAVKMVSSAPVSSQNAVVWTLLVKQAFADKVPNRAFKLFSDMKKRGFQPTARTYATLFSGYNGLSESELTDKQWERIEALWGQYQAYLESIRSQEEQDAALHSSSHHDNILSPYVPFLELLGKRGLHDRIMTLFEEIEESGLLARDKYVYTTFLLQVVQRTGLDGKMDSLDVVRIRNAEDTQVIASKMQAAGVIDSFALTAILRGLVKGTEAHHRFGYDLVAATVGDISKPDELVNAKGHTFVKLEHRSLDLILELCCVMRKHEVAANLFDGLKRSAAKRILTRSHVDYALDALAYEAAEAEQATPLVPEQSQANGEPMETTPSTDLQSYSKRALEILEYAVIQGYGDHPMEILPNRATYNRVLVTAWRCGDWVSAARTVELMTGLDLSQFRQPRAPSWFRRNIAPQKSKDKIIGLDAQSMGYLVRTANKLRDNSAIRVAVRLFDYSGFSTFFSTPRKGARRLGQEVRTSEGFYQFRLAAAIQESAIVLMDSQLTPEQRADYKALLEQVKDVKERLKAHER